MWQHTRLNGTATPISGGAKLGSVTATEKSDDLGIDAAGLACKNAKWLHKPMIDRSGPIEATRSGARVRKLKLANGGRGEMQFGTD
jgi:hypothetical protein